jgi:hypothetical protein
MASGGGVDQMVYFSPGMGCTVKLRSMIPEDGTDTSPIPSPGTRSEPPLKGEEFVSDVRIGPPTFMMLYDQGLVTTAQADDAVEAWHESGDDEHRSLPEYLGMSETEYYVWCMAPRALPLILRARREGAPLRELLLAYLAELRSAANPGDRSVIHALSGWLEQSSAANG